jgi:hypothetical protein
VKTALDIGLPVHPEAEPRVERQVVRRASVEMGVGGPIRSAAASNRSIRASDSSGSNGVI